MYISGLYVDGMKNHLLDHDNDMHTLRGDLVPLLLYAEDLILMSTSATELPEQLDSGKQIPGP